ncbi:hypothetical protein P154DRAFT_124413 [Amniculicola lignicola CBS 123094]|uniref:Arrestin-like N-terminal domain-containing protein n=1 Tax=Amniculicola lignicola CBS 123094 TaxID=1392246 RepID=A0A6A5WPM7_9PLEO|nr:hypothetical protein P154DRAFT_124413 [Amniculicola lignicola CBS 123094]
MPRNPRLNTGLPCVLLKSSLVPAFPDSNPGYTMASIPNLRVILDSDHSQVYRPGDKVKGRVVLVVEKQERIESLRLNFAGTCVTKTTRPIYVSGNDMEVGKSRREYEERITLFDLKQNMVPGQSFAPNKYTWDFEFTFPERTIPRYSRFAHGSRYMKDPHPLPPCFQSRTDSPGGRAMISYYIQARLSQSGSKVTKKVSQALPYHPNPRSASTEAKITSRVLYTETFKLGKDTRTAVDRVFSKVSRNSENEVASPRIVPTIYFPEVIAPGQNIPLLLSLANADHLQAEGSPECLLDSLAVTISTYTTSMCGKGLASPEDVVKKHVTCISKHDINRLLSFESPTQLTTNFRLVDDAECVPSFKSYNISRRYTLTVVVGIRSGGQKFTVRSTTPLDISPRIPLPPLRTRYLDEDGHGSIEPLPLYEPREPVSELAPDYETLYSLSPTSSECNSLVVSRTSSFIAGMPTPSSAPTTPASEPEQLTFDSGTPPMYMEEHPVDKTDRTRTEVVGHEERR